MLTAVRQRFSSVTRLFIGNLPDKMLLHDFFDRDAYAPGIEDEPASAIGLWRTVEEFADLATSTGWRPEFRRMPASYYAAHYRYDAVLMPI